MATKKTIKDTKQKTTGQKLAGLRKKKKISLEELSEQTGLTIQHLEKIEEGDDFAPVGDILKISRVLTVNPEDLFQPGDEKELKKKRLDDFKKREEAYQYTVLTPKGNRFANISFSKRKLPKIIQTNGVIKITTRIK